MWLSENLLYVLGTQYYPAPWPYKLSCSITLILQVGPSPPHSVTSALRICMAPPVKFHLIILLRVFTVYGDIENRPAPEPQREYDASSLDVTFMSVQRRKRMLGLVRAYSLYTLWSRHITPRYADAAHGHVRILLMNTHCPSVIQQEFNIDGMGRYTTTY